ncbi:MAG: DUF167 domain-containing protein [Pyrinomonadaceae bacterium]
MIDLLEKEGSLIFAVKVIPRSSKAGFAGDYGGVLKIKVSAPPVDGAANAELVKMISKIFSVSRSNVEIISGESSVLKRIRISGITRSEFFKALSGE